MSEAVASNASTNRKTVIEIANLPKGKKQLIQNINYGKCDFSKFIKILKITLKQSPDDPDYSIDRILTQSADGPPDVWTEETFPGEQLLALDKVSIKVYVTEIKVLTPAQQRRQLGAAASAVAASSLEKRAQEVSSILSPSSRKYISPARKASTPSRASPARAQRATPSESCRPASPAGAQRSRVLKSAIPATPNRSAIKLMRPRESPIAQPVNQTTAADKRPSQSDSTVPMDEPSKLTDEPNEAHFTSSDTIGDLISSLCGRAADSEIVNQSRINQTWKTRNSDGSITSSSEVGSEICDPVSRDHSVASIEVVEAVEEQTVPRNLGMAMDSACDVAIRAEDSDSDVAPETVDSMDCMPPRQLSASAISATATHSFRAAKRSSMVQRPDMSIDKRVTESYSADAGTALIDGKTAAQVVQSWATSLRKTGGGNFPTKPTPKKTPSKGGSRSDFASKSHYGGGGFSCSNVSPKMNRAMRKETRDTTDAEGRPSMATMTAQWEFMREQFLSSSDEQLEWMMESRRGGAYKYAHRKNEKAEDQYFKSIVDIEVLETKLKLLKSENGPMSKILQELAESHDVLFLNPHNDEEQQKVYGNQVMLKNLVDNELKSIFSTDLEKELKSLTDSSDFAAVARRARKVFTTSLPEEIRKVAAKLAFANKINSESLKEMEKWCKREKETAEYDRVMAEEDKQWMAENEEKNMAALRLMRTLIPVDITAITTIELMNRARSAGHLLSLELATEIKLNKMLQWIVMAPEDIAFDNFLNGEKRQYFANIEGFDVTEMRAVRMCLPQRFELDSDGQKAEWRERFIMRLKQLAGQENRDMVRGPWDFEAGKRSMVKLPPLKDDQARRPLYFFRNFLQSTQKLKQYDDRACLLEKKEGWLAVAEISAAELKTEYDTILLESRDNDFKATYGANVVQQAKEMAKKSYQDAELKVKALKRDVELLKNTISNATVTREDFAESMTAVKEYLQSRNIDWETETEPVKIIGTFPEDPIIVRNCASEAAKFLSPEEEANKRRAEIELISQKVCTDVLCAKVAVEEAEDNSNCFVASANNSGESSDNVDHEKLSSVQATVGAFDTRRRSMFDAPAIASAPIGRRRNSVLESANADMINKLNSMLSGNGPAPPAGVKILKRNSLMLPAKPQIGSIEDSENADANIPPPTPKVIQTKSNTLLKLLHGSTTKSESNHRSGPALSFLDQIKAKRGGLAIDAVETASTASSVNFLDAIKNSRRRIEE